MVARPQGCGEEDVAIRANVGSPNAGQIVAVVKQSYTCYKLHRATHTTQMNAYIAGDI